ncbi:hypothetical protein AQUCO_00700347v1 [Aquilegia coerulea]|uniref:Uncharacterized protein n=1 Tax=Aquilegia coerulea TaxID=218851 RepID=A0A2G5EJN3_AQUCA|nr:hypothetical protein AQUCO_00700347v1 [Aquilegia coerulea]
MLLECAKRLQLLNSPEERRRRIQEIPEIHADPSMDPSEKSGDDTNLYDKRQGNHMKQNDTGFNSEGRNTISPEKGLLLNMAWSRGREFSMNALESSKNMTTKRPSPKGDIAIGFGEKTAGPSGSHESDNHQTNSWEKSVMNSGTVNDQVVVGSGSSSESVLASVVGETDKVWNYQDPSGKTQGPFSMLELCKWSRTASFAANLRIWKTMDTQDDSILLTEALDNTFSRPPKVTAAYENKRVDKLTNGCDFLSGQLTLFSTSSPGCSSHMRESNDCSLVISQMAHDLPTNDGSITSVNDQPSLASVEKGVKILNPDCKYNHSSLQHSSSPKADPGEYIITSPGVSRKMTHPSWTDNRHAVSQIDVSDLQTKSGESTTSSKVDAETRSQDISVSLSPLSNQLTLFSTSSPVSAKPMKGPYSCCDSSMYEPNGCRPLPSQSAHELLTKDDKIKSSKNDHASSQRGSSPKADPGDYIMTKPTDSREMPLLSWTGDPEMIQPSLTDDPHAVLQNDVSDSQTRSGECPHTSSEMAGETRPFDISAIAVVDTQGVVSEPPQPSLDGALMDIGGDSVISPAERSKHGSESNGHTHVQNQQISLQGGASGALHLGNSGWDARPGNVSKWGSHQENHGNRIFGHQSQSFPDNDSSYRSVSQNGSHQNVPCKYYIRARCRDEHCGYIHQRIPCKYYMAEGYCRKGNSCLFVHDGGRKNEIEMCRNYQRGYGRDSESFPPIRHEETLNQNEICGNYQRGYHANGDSFPCIHDEGTKKICTNHQRGYGTEGESCPSIHDEGTLKQNEICRTYQRGYHTNGDSFPRIHDVGTKQICRDHLRGHCSNGESYHRIHVEQKKEICFKNLRGQCQYGESCYRIHVERINEICVNHLRGHCLYGVSCHRIHVEDTAEICRDYQDGHCMNGGSCPLIHAERTKEVCKNYRRGYCTDGENCFFAHCDEETGK